MSPQALLAERPPKPGVLLSREPTYFGRLLVSALRWIFERLRLDLRHIQPIGN
jgi:hypothetical protein